MCTIEHLGMDCVSTDNVCTLDMPYLAYNLFLVGAVEVKTYFLSPTKATHICYHIFVYE